MMYHRYLVMSVEEVHKLVHEHMAEAMRNKFGVTDEELSKANFTMERACQAQLTLINKRTDREERQ